jgi:hypothetical protein
MALRECDMSEPRYADRRSFRRYQIGIPAALYGQDGVRTPCTLVDISTSGALVYCKPIADDKVITLWLSGFGELCVSRLRAKGEMERLIFRESDFRIRQLIRFLGRLIEAGAAAPTSQRRSAGRSVRNIRDSERVCTFDEAMLHWVDKALSIAACETRRIDKAFGNIVPFPARRQDRGENPDSVA